MTNDTIVVIKFLAFIVVLLITFGIGAYFAGKHLDKQINEIFSKVRYKALYIIGLFSLFIDDNNELPEDKSGNQKTD